LEQLDMFWEFADILIVVFGEDSLRRLNNVYAVKWEILTK